MMLYPGLGYPGEYFPPLGAQQAPFIQGFVTGNATISNLGGSAVEQDGIQGSAVDLDDFGGSAAKVE
jgi:hypothetical protein